MSPPKQFDGILSLPQRCDVDNYSGTLGGLRSASGVVLQSGGIGVGSRAARAHVRVKKMSNALTSRATS